MSDGSISSDRILLALARKLTSANLVNLCSYSTIVSLDKTNPVVANVRYAFNQFTISSTFKPSRP
jgi:hypothetical protein